MNTRETTNIAGGVAIDERIPMKLIGAIVAVGSLAFIGILTETVMTVLFPQLMREFNVDTATVQWITTIYLLAVAATMPLSSFIKRRFRNKTIFVAAVVLAVLGSLIMIVAQAFPLILLAVAATMPLSSFIKRRFRNKTIFVAAVVLAVLGSLIMIVAQAFPLILAARVIQGIGSGMATPLMMNIILEQSPRSKVGRLMGVGSLVITVAPAIGPTVGGAVTSVLPWRLMMNIILEQSPRSKVGRLMGVGSLVITVAPAIGPTVGGAVTSVLPWRAIFVIVIPIILLISLPVGLKCIQQKHPTEDAVLNPLQFVAIVLALCGLIMFLNQAGVAVGAAVSGGEVMLPALIAVASLVVGVGSLLFFGWSSRRSFSPLIRLGFLRNRIVLLHLLPYAILPMVGIGFGYVITNLAQLSLGTDAFVAGALVLPGALIGAFCAPIGGMLYDKFGPTRPILTAFSVATIATVLLLVCSMHLTPALLAGLYFIFGLSYALEFSLRARILEYHDQRAARGAVGVHPGRQRRVPDLHAVRRCGRHRVVLHHPVGGAGRCRRRGDARVHACHRGRRHLDLRRHDRHLRPVRGLPGHGLPPAGAGVSHLPICALSVVCLAMAFRLRARVSRTSR